LKRRHGLSRCRYRGAQAMQRSVGLGVIANNLLTVDPRMLAIFDVDANNWHVLPGGFQFSVASSSRDVRLKATSVLRERMLSLERQSEPQRFPPPRVKSIK